MSNNTAQHVAMTFYLRYQYIYLKNEGALDMVGTTIEGYVRVEKEGKYVKEIQEIEVTLSGLLAASHLVGMGDINKKSERCYCYIGRDV